MKNLIKTLAKSVLITLGLTAAASAADARIHKSILGSGRTTIKANDEMEDIIKIVTSLEDSGLLLKRVSDTIQNEVKEQKGGFPSMLFRYIRYMFIRKYISRKSICISVSVLSTKCWGCHPKGLFFASSKK